MQLNLPFASKELANGDKIFRRNHGYQHLMTTGESSFEVVVPFKCKLQEAEVIWCPEQVSVDFKVLDTAAGNYSGVPNYMLDQFGWAVNVAKDMYKDRSEFEADLYTGMRIQVTVYNNSGIEKTIGFNIKFCEIRTPAV